MKGLSRCGKYKLDIFALKNLLLLIQFHSQLGDRQLVPYYPLVPRMVPLKKKRIKQKNTRRRRLLLIYPFVCRLSVYLKKKNEK